MAVDMTIRAGDSHLSPTWAVVIAGQAVDLEEEWTVRAQARDSDGDLVIDWQTQGRVLLGSADVTVGSGTVTTSTVRLYLPPAVTEDLEARDRLLYDVEISHPTFGPLDDLYRVTLRSGTARIVRDVTR
ncbi:hypothetical protein [Pseudonocardia sp. NPDC049154]|uniref:hypothetical protein n=1 Tax=Pseudonocardia sp. NPDC049154 TaxID=3155501 RepID=UPI0033CC348E